MCNGKQSCARSMITSHKNGNDLIFKANGQLYSENNGDENYYISESNFNLMEVDQVNIACNGDSVCNNLIFNIYNDTTNVSAIFDNKFNHNPTAHYIHLHAQNVNQLNMTLAAEIADSIFIAPHYDIINNKTKSYLYCNDYGCNNIGIQSLNGLSDWNISIGGECECDKINDCVYLWEIDCILEIDCGQSGQYVARWYGNNYCIGNNECCSNSSAIQLVQEYDNFIDTCPHKKKNDSLSTLDYIIIVICSVGVVILAISIGICCNWYLKKKEKNEDKGYMVFLLCNFLFFFYYFFDECMFLLL
eukprot:125297_1